MLECLIPRIRIWLDIFLCERRLYPGHGPVVETARNRIMLYISHRQQRENQVLEVVKEAGGKPLSALQVRFEIR